MITVRKQIERAIRKNDERNHRLKTLLKSMPKDRLDTEIDPAQVANETYREADDMGLARFIHEEYDEDDLVLRGILQNIG